MAAPEARLESDTLGDRAIPHDAYFGIHTLRATENFSVSGTAISSHPALIRALAAVKQAAATANTDLGLLDPSKAAAIITTCEEIRAGALHEHFVVDVIQGGAGTSTNMNANEVIANRGLEHLGHDRGQYQYLHPLDDVNMGQSTNDVYPTAAKVAICFAIEQLLAALADLETAFRDKANEFADVLKMGRTQLQEAVPMTLGQEFGAFARMVLEDRERLPEVTTLLHEVNLGGTAIGTGLNTHPRYATLACEHLAQITGMPFVGAADLIEATQDVGVFVHLSGVLKRVAVKVSKMCSDLRLLASGPHAGFGEIRLPAVQAGSSMMPGKVNPVIAEMVNQVAYEVFGHDVTITIAADSGQLQLNAFEPIIVHSLLESLTHLRVACRTLATRCVSGITANREHMLQAVDRSIGLATALSPHIGYAQADAIARDALASGRSVSDLVVERGFLTRAQLDMLRPHHLTAPMRIHVPTETDGRHADH